MLSKIVLLVCLGFVAVFAESEHIISKYTDSKCPPTEEHMNVALGCVMEICPDKIEEDIMLAFCNLTVRVLLAECVWNKLGVIKNKVFQCDSVKTIVDSLNVTAEVKEKLVQNGKDCCEKFEPSNPNKILVCIHTANIPVCENDSDFGAFCETRDDMPEE